MEIYGIVLAAGMSRRWQNRNKLILPFKGHTVIEEVILQMAASEVDKVIVVIGHQREMMVNLLTRINNPKIELVFNPDYRLGRAESIKCAISRIKDNADAALFTVADKPGIEKELINKAVAEFKDKCPALLYVETPSGRGHPIIFSKGIFDDLLALKGDTVGNQLVFQYRDKCLKLCDDKPQIDIDTDEDYQNLLKQYSKEA